MTKPINVFVSYSWGIENGTKIVDILEKLCPERGINLIRDSNKLKHGESIQKFIDDLSDSDHLITIFSEPYFRSKWCMYELLRTYQNGNFEKRTHPIIADDCDLQDSGYRKNVTDFWVKIFNEEQAKFAGQDPLMFLPEHERIKIYRDISQNVNDILNYAANRLNTPLKDLKNQNFSQLLDGIQKIQISPDNQLVISDEDYLQEIRLYLEKDLKKSDAFSTHLNQYCSQDPGSSLPLAEYLVQQSLEGEFVGIIQNLQAAFVDSYEAVNPNEVITLKKLNEVAEGVLSKLVVFNIKDEWMSQYRKECGARNHHEQVLPEMSFGSVEVVMSREARTLPKFYVDKHSLTPQGAKGVALESGIRSKDIIRDLIKRIYSRVMETELAADVDENQAIAKLQRTIKQRKQQKHLKLRKNYFLSLPIDRHSGLADPVVKEKLKELLPDLSLIEIRSDCREDVFIVEDEELMVAISEFFKTLEDYPAK